MILSSTAMRRFLGAMGLVAGLCPSPIWAQTTSRSTLNVGLDVSAVNDSDVADEIRQRSAQGGLLTGGISSSLVGTAGYSRQLRRLRLNGSLRSSVRYYSEADHLTPVSYTGGLTAGIPLPGQTNLTLTQSATHSPSYLYQLFPSSTAVDPTMPMALAQDYRVDESTSLTYVTRVAVSMPSVLGALSVSGERLGSEFSGATDTRPATKVDIGRVGLSWRFGRRHTLSTDYQYRQGHFGGSGQAVDQRMSVIAGYIRPLSSTRSASFRISVAPSLFRPPPTLLSGDRTRHRIEGQSWVSVDLSRSWAVSASFRRGMDYIATLSEPIVNTGVSLGVDGSLGQRLQLGINASYGDGGSALTDTRQDDKLGTYTGSARLGFALTRSISAYGQYLYYHYNLRDQARLAPSLPSVFDRRSVQFGLSFSARPLGR
jgi:hypothetical protein